MAEVQGIDTTQLLQNIDASFSLKELKILSFELKIDFDEISDGKKKSTIVELIDYCKRRGRLLELVRLCERERPHIQWFLKIQPQSTSFETVDERIAHRDGLYEQANGLQLVHTILPSTGQENYAEEGLETLDPILQTTPRQENYWDILIYLIRHQSDDLTMVDHAEFFLGKYWDNKIFHAANSEGFIGIAISAYGPALCTCRVLFTDGRSIMLSRYIDFEMAHLFDPPQQVSQAKAEVIGVMSHDKVIKLSQLLATNFMSEELNQLGYELGVEMEAIPGDNMSAKAREFVSYVQRHGILPELIEHINLQRPEISLDEIMK